MIVLLLMLILSQEGTSFKVKEQIDEVEEDTGLVPLIKEKFVVNSVTGPFCTFSVSPGMTSSSGIWETQNYDNVLQGSFMCSLTLFPSDPKQSPENVVGLFSMDTRVYVNTGNFTITDPAGRRSFVLKNGDEMPSLKLFLPAMVTFTANKNFTGRFRVTMMTVPTAFFATATKLPQQLTMNPDSVKSLPGSQQFTSLILTRGSCLLKQCPTVQATLKTVNLLAGEMLIVSLDGPKMSSQTVTIFGPTSTNGQTFVSKSSDLGFYYFRNDDGGTFGSYRVFFSGK